MPLNPQQLAYATFCVAISSNHPRSWPRSPLQIVSLDPADNKSQRAIIIQWHGAVGLPRRKELANSGEPKCEPGPNSASDANDEVRHGCQCGQDARVTPKGAVIVKADGAAFVSVVLVFKAMLCSPWASHFVVQVPRRDTGQAEG